MLNVNFKEQYGYFKTGDFTCGIYKANCLCAFCYETQENNKKLMSLYGFFNDLTHLKRCLGLVKGFKSIFGENTEFFIFNDKLNKDTRLILNYVSKKYNIHIIKREL